MTKQTKKTVFVLDGGGTGFKYSAVRDYKELMKPFTVPASGNSLEEILNKLIAGFEKVNEMCKCPPDAISFCFPGPADYENGIIGDLENLPHFRGGVALKAMLEEIFHVPVFINNDGDLFTYGEAISGFLPYVNNQLEKYKNPKRYRNLLGVTMGTGFGGGIVINGKLLLGDNSASGEINRMRNLIHPESSVEDSVSIRAIKRVYAREADINSENCPEPHIIYKIALGESIGNQDAAIKAWDELARAAADAIANATTLIDGLVVIGGGLSGAYPLFLDKLVKYMNQSFMDKQGKLVDRMEIKAYNLENEESLKVFLQKSGGMIKVPFSETEVWYDPGKKTGVGISQIGTSSAVAIGAYAFALQQLRSITT
jgi:glucokinase